MSEEQTAAEPKVEAKPAAESKPAPTIDEEALVNKITSKVSGAVGQHVSAAMQEKFAALAGAKNEPRPDPTESDSAQRIHRGRTTRRTRSRR